MQGITIKPISAFSDNYIWMLIDEKGKLPALSTRVTQIQS